MQPLTELTSALNWNIALRADFQAETTSYGKVLTPIPPCEFSVSSNALVIAVENGNAPERWRLGAWVSIRAPGIDTGATTVVSSPVEILRRTITLRTRHLITIPNYGIYPYQVQLSFPKWHSAILVEAWWYDDERTDPTEEYLKEILSKFPS